MKKILRIAFVFALAGATLMYTGCSKDYSEDIDKLDMEIQSVAGSIQSLQSQVVNALSEAQKALTEAQAAAKAAANAGTAASANADAIKAANAEVAKLEARVAALEAAQAKLDEIIEAKIAGKADKSEIEAAIAEIQSIVDAALAQVSGNFSVAAIKEFATYAYATWAPDNDRTHAGYYKKLAEKFPELAEIKKGDEVAMFGALPFIVNPSTVALDDTYKFSLVYKNGDDSGIELGNPNLGYAVKSDNNVWNVEVQGPAHTATGGSQYGMFTELSLVVENADGISAQTAFDYSVWAYENNSQIFKLATPLNKTIKFQDPTIFDHNTVDLKDLGIFNTTQGTWPWYTDQSAPLYNDYFVVDAADPADIVKYGLSFDGSKITIDNGPDATAYRPAYIQFTITAIGVNGKTDQKVFTLIVNKADIAPNAELEPAEVTLKYENNSYATYVDYDLEAFGFNDLELKEVVNALAGTANTVTAYNSKGEETTLFSNIITNIVTFIDANGDTTRDYREAKAMRLTVASNVALPGVYDITITDGSVFCAVGKLTVKNPETAPIKLAEFLCDENGVLQIVGSVNNQGKITYDLTNITDATGNNPKRSALVYKTTEATILEHAFVDEDAEYIGDEWMTEDGVFSIPVATQTQNLLYTPRNFSVKYGWFGNADNEGTFEFTAQAVSPIYTEDGANITIDDTKITAYFKPDAAKNESATIDLTKVIKNGKYVASEKKGTEFKISYTPAVVAEPAGDFKWNLDAKIPDITKEVGTYNVSGEIAHSNVRGGWILIDKDSKPITISLDEALALGFVTTEQYLTFGADEAFKYYLTDSDWTALKDAWTTFYEYGYIYNNAKVGKDVTEAMDEDTVKAKNNEAEEKLKGASAVQLSRIAKFEDLLGTVVLPTKGRWEMKATVQASDAVLTPKELAEYPTFKVDETEYGAYATFSNNKITAKDTYAGQSDVTIPVTAEIKDIWGMTTKKTFNVVLKVK